jgi:Domain of unknown function (DUF1413)
MFEKLYNEIPARLAMKNPPNGFNLEDLFTKEEWSQIGDRTARQQFGIRFAKAVEKGDFPRVVRNAKRNDDGGNEARYNFIPET